MYNMQWTTSCIDVLNEALFGQFLPFDFYRSTPSKQPVDKRLGWLLSDSANTSIGSDFSHNSDIRSVLQGFVFQHNFKETNFCCLIVPVFQNSKWIVPYSEVFWLCESERCRCCKLVCVKNVSSNMVWSGWILSAKNMLQAALSSYYVASTSQCTEINFFWSACISYGMHTDSGILLVSSEFSDTSWPALKFLCNYVMHWLIFFFLIFLQVFYLKWNLEWGPLQMKDLSQLV